MWEYYRNDALNGINYFAVTKPYMLRNQFGANLGGPIKRDKTFFFFNYERLLFDQAADAAVQSADRGAAGGRLSLDGSATR